MRIKNKVMKIDENKASKNRRAGISEKGDTSEMKKIMRRKIYRITISNTGKGSTSKMGQG